MKLLCVQVVKDLLGDGIDVSTIHTVQSFNMMTLMHLSIAPQPPGREKVLGDSI